ncbi:hypothetical protein [Thiolapillus sp.]
MSQLVRIISAQAGIQQDQGIVPDVSPGHPMIMLKLSASGGFSIESTSQAIDN